MTRLPNVVFDDIYHQLHMHAQEEVDNRYPCGEGGWIHLRILTDEDLEDAKALLSSKAEKMR